MVLYTHTYTLTNTYTHTPELGTWIHLWTRTSQQCKLFNLSPDANQLAGFRVCEFVKSIPMATVTNHWHLWSKRRCFNTWFKKKRKKKGRLPLAEWDSISPFVFPRTWNFFSSTCYSSLRWLVFVTRAHVAIFHTHTNNTMRVWDEVNKCHRDAPMYQPYILMGLVDCNHPICRPQDIHTLQWPMFIC